MELNNIIKILPNIYLCNNINIINQRFIKTNSISHILFINNMNENYDINNNEDDELNNILNKINININETNINFIYTNQILIDILKKSNNVLIISKNNIIGFIIISAFLIKNLDISFFQILVLNKKFNFQLDKTIYYKILNDYYNHNKKILN